VRDPDNLTWEILDSVMERRWQQRQGLLPSDEEEFRLAKAASAQKEQTSTPGS
jgi:hypothetical protein